MAAGVPIPSPIVFGFLASTAEKSGWPWLFAGLYAGFFTVSGHAACYMVFRQFGSFIRDRIVNRYPIVSEIFSRISYLKLDNPKKDIKSTFTFFLLRWIGVGYSQVFWVLGLSGHDALDTLRILFLSDIIWACVWSFGLTKLLISAPLINRYLTRFGWILLILGLFGYILKRLLGRK